MNENIIGVDHIGYAVKNIEDAKNFLELLGFKFKANQVDNLRNVNVSLGINTYEGGGYYRRIT